MADHDYNDAARILGEVAEAMHLDEGQLHALGHEALGIIVTRTSAGLDADGKPFAPYSPAYAKVRSAHNLSTTPDLARTGHMLGATSVTATSESVALTFNSSVEAKKAAAHNYGARPRPRKDTYKKTRKAPAPPSSGLPQREFFDVRLDEEWRALSESAGVQLLGNVEKVWPK